MLITGVYWSLDGLPLLSSTCLLATAVENDVVHDGDRVASAPAYDTILLGGTTANVIYSQAETQGKCR